MVEEDYQNPKTQCFLFLVICYEWNQKSKFKNKNIALLVFGSILVPSIFKKQKTVCFWSKTKTQWKQRTPFEAEPKFCLLFYVRFGLLGFRITCIFLLEVDLGLR